MWFWFVALGIMILLIIYAGYLTFKKKRDSDL